MSIVQFARTLASLLIWLLILTLLPAGARGESTAADQAPGETQAQSSTSDDGALPGLTVESTAPDDKAKPASTTGEKPFRKIAEGFIDGILEGIKENDYKMFSRDMTYELKCAITRDKFKLLIQKFDNEIGTYQSREYLGELTQGPFKIALWKGKFSKTPNDILMRCLIGELDGSHKIFGFWLQ